MSSWSTPREHILYLVKPVHGRSSEPLILHSTCAISHSLTLSLSCSYNLATIHPSNHPSIHVWNTHIHIVIILYTQSVMNKCRRMSREMLLPIIAQSFFFKPCTIKPPSMLTVSLEEIWFSPRKTSKHNFKFKRLILWSFLNKMFLSSCGWGAMMAVCKWERERERGLTVVR